MIDVIEIGLINDLQTIRLEGILNLIDTIQDYAVDEMGIDENEIYDIYTLEKNIE